MTRLREPFGKAGLTVAIIALIAALAGGAYAAQGLNGKQKKEVKAIAKGVQGSGPAGPAGPQGNPGATGANGKDGIGTPGKDGVSVTTAAASGVECPSGGIKVTSVSGTIPVCNGETGFTETLPSSKTETGSWTALGEGLGASTDKAAIPIPFAIPLEEGLDGEHVQVNGLGYPATDEAKCEAKSEPEKATCLAKLATSTANCPGIAEGPEAAPGFLCIYIATGEFAGSLVLKAGGEGFSFGASTAGAHIIATLEGPAPLFVNGTYAVTAP
jgi:hypothetical protein